YWFSVHTKSKVPVGVEHTAEFEWDDGVKRQRRLLHPNKTDTEYEIDRIDFGTEPRRLRIRYDEKKTTLADLVFTPQAAVAVPKPAQNYQPPFAPPARHPRLLVNPEALAKIKAGLNEGVNAEVWKAVSAAARKPFVFNPPPEKEVMYDPEVAEAISQKAFYYLVTGDRTVGREAIELDRAYLGRVIFGNGQDICRKVGEMIYRTSQVYDWCYDLLTPEEKKWFRERMLYLAGELEIGWPPFKQSVNVGHGNEAQLSRDLLAMAIAVYDEDPVPYRYAMYEMLEKFQPAKRFLYQSGRHDQGSGYGGYRFSWDLFAALQFRRTFNYDLLAPETARVPYYWHYIRTPDERLLVEGDANWAWAPRRFGNQPVLLTALALWPDPELKEEFRRLRPKMDYPTDPVFFLLVNDPFLKPQDRRAELPLLRATSAPLPGLTVRTGWNFGKNSNDVVITMHGADHHLRNHQHLDAGAFQIYYRGHLAADLGQYKTYGMPYDWNFAKSTVSHSAMRFLDPEQKSLSMGPQFTANSGGQEVKGWWPPADLDEMNSEGIFRNGRTVAAGWGPSDKKPDWAFMEVDLGILYPGRVKSYSRTFVYLPLGKPDTPALLAVLDRFTKAADRVIPIFQLTSFAAPVEKDGRIEVVYAPNGPVGKLTMETLIPASAKKTILTGKAAHTVGGEYFPPRVPDAPEAKGSRTEVTGPGNVFLNLIQVQDGAAAPLPATTLERDGRIVLNVAGRLVDFGDALQPSARAVSWQVAKPGTQVLILDLAPGVRTLIRDEKEVGKVEIKAGEGSYAATLEPGQYVLRP
ncbi:MAG: hypothetical protein AB7F32_14110, partial [Victivallaceae bacterium]